MFYIHSISSISHQLSFQSEGFSEKLFVLNDTSSLEVPDFKDILPPTALRRLSPILKISLTTALECRNDKEFDAIVVGTALGCLQDTEKFLNTIRTSTSETLSPTAFIQSTHNTIGGQISLFLKNHAYNMTHTQNALSFEIALIDAITLLKEGNNNVLVGAADEKIELLEKLRNSIIRSKYPLTSLATFFNLKNDQIENGIVLKDVTVNLNSTIQLGDFIDSFLEKNGIQFNEILKVYHSDCKFINGDNTMNYLPYTGLNYSASALATHMAYDELSFNDKGLILIVNNICNNDFGLTLIEKC